MSNHPNFEYDDRLFPFNDIAHEEEDLEEKEPSTELNPLETDGA